MTRKIFRSIFVAATAVLLLSFSIITAVLYHHSSEMQKEQLHAELYLTSKAVEIHGLDYLNTLELKDCRITWIDKDGSVLFDSQALASAMENHSDREEIASAFQTGSGESYRNSKTFIEKTMYSDLLLSDGTVLRISTALDTIWALLGNVMLPFITVFIFAVIVSILLARSMSKAIVSPLNDLNLEQPLLNDTYDEIAPLLTKINKQNKQINKQQTSLAEKTDEFEQIISVMNEGLVLINNHGKILSINNAAQNIFEVNGDIVGEDFLKIDHTLPFSRGLSTVFEKGHTEFHISKKGREYQFDISRIDFNGEPIGAVILAFDVTDTAFAERNRREFTANVSHELKTPLQSIIGSAELLESGLVKPEDTTRFVGHIKKEATRLVTLINDIIHLSELDENQELTKENVDLLEVAVEVMEVLTASAQKKHVTFSLKGEALTIHGIRRYLYEILYNLCDNAVRYNVDGGSVTIQIRQFKNDAVLTVSDTGIGIPEEDHARIFERFYRVDKSHSKETGGTGLGLSIVKHAVAYHGGKIDLSSAPGKGTTIRVTFVDALSE